MPRSHRIALHVPELAARSASGLAERAGHTLTPYLHAYLIDAVRVAEAGRGDLLPAAITMAEALDALEAQWNAQHPDKPYDRAMTKVAITASSGDRRRWETAFEAHGLTLFAVVWAALRAFQESGGSWVDTAMPGDAARSLQAAGAA